MNGIEACFMGRVGNDPELKTSQAGKPWLRINVAVGQDDATQWVQVACFGDRAQELAGHLRKSDRIYVEGRLTMRTWEKDGKTQAGLSVAAWKVERLAEIGRSKPVKPKAPPEGENPALPAAGGDRRNGDGMRDWQAPIDDQIPFAPEWR